MHGLATAHAAVRQSVRHGQGRWHPGMRDPTSKCWRISQSLWHYGTASSRPLNPSDKAGSLPSSMARGQRSWWSFPPGSSYRVTLTVGRPRLQSVRWNARMFSAVGCPREAPAKEASTSSTDGRLRVPLASWASARRQAGDVGLPLLSNRRRATTASASAVAKELDAAYKTALPFTSIPSLGGLRDLPYIGSLLLFKPFTKFSLETMGFMIEDLHEKLGPVFRIRFGNMWVVISENLDDTDAIFRSEGEYPFRNPVPILQVYNRRSAKKRPLLGNVNGPEWKRIRTPMNRTISRPKGASLYLSSQEHVAVEFANALYRRQHDDPHVLTDLFFRFATESIGVICFNKRLGFLDEDFDQNWEKQELIQCFIDNIALTVQSMTGQRVLFHLFKDSFYKRFEKAYGISYEYTLKCIRETFEEIKKQKEEGTFNPDDPNFLISLLTTQDIDDDAAFGIIYTILTAGIDSTSRSLQLLFYNLATNPDKQQRLADEVLALLGPHGHLTPEALAKMSYLKASVKESLRLCFPVPLVNTRILEHDTVISGYQVPKGKGLTVSAMMLSVSPKYYDQPDAFLPERWLRDRSGQRQQDINFFAYVPFGFGARNCAGMRFALQELYLATTKVIQKYHIDLREDCPELEFIFTPFRGPKHPLPFTLTPRP